MKKKANNKGQFPEYILRNWEDNDGINFAIALSRITGWILNVSWWSPTDEHEIVEKMKPLRVYVQNNSNQIYDIRGKQTIATFSNNIIIPRCRKRGYEGGGVVDRCYSEQMLFDLPLRIKPCETKIEEAQVLIRKNTDFLGRIPLRNEPKVPAFIAAKFTYGSCCPFATALFDLKGFKPIAIIAKEYLRPFELTKPGYVHSLVKDKDDNFIDAWGKDSLENIIQRYHVAKYELSEAEHYATNLRLKTNSPEKYNELYEESVAIINEYF